MTWYLEIGAHWLMASLLQPQHQSKFPIPEPLGLRSAFIASASSLKRIAQVRAQLLGFEKRRTNSGFVAVDCSAGRLLNIFPEGHARGHFP